MYFYFENFPWKPVWYEIFWRVEFQRSNTNFQSWSADLLFLLISYSFLKS